MKSWFCTRKLCDDKIIFDTLVNKQHNLKMEQQRLQKSFLHKLLVIVSFLLGLFALLASFFLDASMYILAIALVAVILGVVVFIMAGKINAPKGIIMGGLVMSLAGILLTAYQFESPAEVEIINKKAAPLKDGKFIESIDSSLSDIESSLKSLEKASAK